MRIFFSVPQYGNNYLTFDTVSLVPYDRKLIDTSLLSSEQVRNHISLDNQLQDIYLQFLKMRYKYVLT